MNCEHLQLPMALSGLPMEINGLCIHCWKARAHFLEAEIDTRKRAHRENEAAFQQMRERAERAEAELDAYKKRVESSEIDFIDEHNARVRSEAACAEMREFIRYHSIIHPVCSPECEHALSSDCGKDFVPRSDLDKANAACAEMHRTVILLDAHITGEAYIKYSQAINHALSTDAGKGWLSPQEAEKRYAEWRSATEELKQQLSVECKRLEAKLAITVEALERTRGLQSFKFITAAQQIAREALSKLKEDKA